MFSDADHEIIDSPEALFRHLYEEHGVEEARRTGPGHSSACSSGSAAMRTWNAPSVPPAAPTNPRTPLHRPSRSRRPDANRNGPSRSGGPSPRPSRSGPRRRRPRTSRRRGPSRRPGPGRERRAQATGGGREGRRPAGFGDPLVEALARALAGRGHDEVAVRSAIRSFADPGRGPAGEAAVRSVFVEPMLSRSPITSSAPPPARPARPRPPNRRRPPRPVPLPRRPLPRPGPTGLVPADPARASRRAGPVPAGPTPGARGTGAARGGMGRALGRPGRHRPAIRRRPRGGRRRRRRPDGRGQRRPGPPPGQAATPLTPPAPHPVMTTGGDNRAVDNRRLSCSRSATLPHRGTRLRRVALRRARGRDVLRRARGRDERPRPPRDDRGWSRAALVSPGTGLRCVRRIWRG